MPAVGENPLARLVLRFFHENWRLVAKTFDEMVMMDHPPQEDTVMGGGILQAYGEPNGFINPQDLFHPRPPGPPSPPRVPAERSLASQQFYHEMKNLPTPECESVDDVEVQEKPRRFLPTGCCYDERMKLHTNADFRIEPHHPEDPRRIQAIFSTFVKHRLVYLGDEAKLAEILYNNPTKYMYRIQAREATKEEITTVHTHDHYEWVYNTSQMESDALRAYSVELDTGRRSLYLGNYTHLAAMVSAGGAIETCKQVVAGNVKNAIALIRPPGHHAEAHEAMGFCFFNNVPIAARVCQADFPESCRKVMILDWDVHHGNGTQNMFYDDPNVLYISLHVWQDGQMYPGPPDDPTKHDDASHLSVGRGRGIGKNVNIPWKTKGMGDGDYMAAFQKIVMPIAQEFVPDLVIVSAGFDAAVGDTLGGCFVTPACYSQMTHMLMSLADGKLAVILEGGYDLKAISRSALAVGKTLMGEPPEPMDTPPINETAVKVLRKVQQAHAPYWECMRPKKVDWKYELRSGSIKGYSVIRAAQYAHLREKHNMLEMIVSKEDLASAMKHQILFTPRISEAKKIFLMIHDPPTTKVDHPETGSAISPDKIWVHDPVRPYIDWAVNNGFGVIDINIPTDLGHELDDDENAVEDAESKKRKDIGHRQRVRDAIVYVWDNYLEEHHTNNVVIMAVGGAYGAIKELLVTRRESSPSLYRATTSVIDPPPIRNFISDKRISRRPALNYRPPFFCANEWTSHRRQSGQQPRRQP